MSPERVNSIVPGESSVPNERNHSGPRSRISGTFARVSTLLATVGFGEPGRRNRPSIHGGTILGRGSFPSITSSCAFSSPNRYSSGPWISSMGTGPTRSCSAISSIAAVSRATSGPKPALIPMNARSAPTA